MGLFLNGGGGASSASVLPALIGQDIVARAATFTGEIGGSGPVINMTGPDTSGSNFMIQFGSSSGMYLSAGGNNFNLELGGSNAFSATAALLLVPALSSSSDVSTHGITIHDTGIGATGGLHLDASTEGTAFIPFLRPASDVNATMLLGGGRIADGSAFTNNIQNSTSGGNDMVQLVTTMSPASGSASFAALDINPTINGVSTGSATALAISSVTNTFTGGKTNLIDAGTSTGTYVSGFTSKFRVDTVGNVFMGAKLVMSNVAPTVSSGFGTSPSIAGANGSVAFSVNVGTGGVATTGVIALPTAPNGWILNCLNTTTSTSFTQQTGSTASTATIGNFVRAGGTALAWATGSVIYITATPF